MGRFDEYNSYLTKYIALYGEKTTVLYQCGMFHEIYGVDNETEQIGNTKKLSNLLGIQLTRTKKAILENSRTNPQMTGFPSINIDKYILILLHDDWTVVVVDQEKIKNKDGSVDRKVTNIWSPSTYVKDPINTDNFMISINIKLVKQRLTEPLYHIGLASIDVSTGVSHVHECFSNSKDSNLAIDETVRFIQSFQPLEVLIESSETNLSQEKIKEMFDLTFIKTHFNTNVSKSNTLNIHETYLSEVFPDHGIISAIEYLNLERLPEARKSYVTILQFCEAHSRNIVTGLKQPIIWLNKESLILDNNAVTQLNIIKSKKSVVNIMNSSSTNMGKRLVRERLLNPICDQSRINERYSLVEFMLSDSGTGIWWNIVEKHLKNIIDIERYQRKISMNILEPIELSSLLQSYNDLITLLTLLKDTPLKFSFTSKLKTLTSWLASCIDEKEASRYNISDITDSFFQRGFNAEIDTISDNIRQDKRQLDLISNKMSDMIGKGGGGEYVTLKHNDKAGYYLDLTKNRFKLLKRNFTCFKSVNSLSEFDINEKNKSNVKISGGIITKLSSSICDHISSLKTICTKVYYELLQKISVEYFSFFISLSEHIAEIDLYKSCAKIATKNNYCKPEIIPDTACQIHAVSLRHPIIEKLVRKTKYVPTNINLNEDGILLYGINASGKSSAMKSIGISLILAQAGFYVPAKEYRYVPYQSLMTRIIGNDDLFKGMSSFAVEMSELRGILSRANSKTLVLGDEICHGTETASAISLVASSLIDLSSKKTSYIFATHLHQLSKMNEVTTIKNLKQLHLTMHYDDTLDEIIYDRILKEGPGPSNYGIEVARAMKIPQSIIDCANVIRNKYFENTTIIRTSKYNKKSMVKNCQIEECSEIAIDSHHIRFQCEADSSGCFKSGQGHKNDISNLVSLCKLHHNMVHVPTDKKLIILGYTESGKLRYTYRIPLKSLKLKKITF
jgi:DNA mismatch repair protein MutS